LKCAKNHEDRFRGFEDVTDVSVQTYWLSFFGPPCRSCKLLLALTIIHCSDDAQ